MKKQITTLYEYQKWANTRILDAMAQQTEQDEKCLELMAHILLSELVWYSRIEGKPELPVWAKKSLNECKEMSTANNMLLAGLVAKQTDDSLNKDINYTNTKGNKYTNTVSQILTHLVNHSTYHRGQIIERLKGKIPAMPITDMIAFMREK